MLAKAKGDEKTILLYEEQISHLCRISEFCIDTTELTYANSHGDYHISQAIIDKNKISIIDWASACKLPICLEIMTSKQCHIFFVFGIAYVIIRQKKKSLLIINQLRI